MTFEMRSAAGVPAGHYPAEFVRAESFDEHANEYGPAVKLVWRVTEGEHAGEEASRICAAKLSPKSNLARFVTALNGEVIAPGATVDLLSFAGVRGLIVVDETESGATRVATFLRS